MVLAKIDSDFVW